MNLKFANPTIGPFPGPGPTYQLLDDVRSEQVFDDELKLLFEASSQICRHHYDLWRFEVVVPAMLPRETISKVRGICESIFPFRNDAELGRGTFENIKTVRESNAERAFVAVRGRQPLRQDILALVDEAHKGPGDSTADVPYLIKDFDAILRQRPDNNPPLSELPFG
jgi:hypothetical protein